MDHPCQASATPTTTPEKASFEANFSLRFFVLLMSPFCVQAQAGLLDRANEMIRQVQAKSALELLLPAEAKGKNYTVKTSLFSNNKTYKQNSNNVAFADDGRVIVLAMAN